MQMPTNKVLAASAAGTVAAPLSLIIVYLFNGIAFGCWGDPTATAVACVNHVPSSIIDATSALFTGGSVLLSGYWVPESGTGTAPVQASGGH